MGDYHLRAVLGETRAEKTVQVKRYVLPKFKVEVKADKSFYLPKETVKIELQPRVRRSLTQAPTSACTWSLVSCCTSGM